MANIENIEIDIDEVIRQFLIINPITYQMIDFKTLIEENTKISVKIRRILIDHFVDENVIELSIYHPKDNFSFYTSVSSYELRKRDHSLELLLA